MKRIALFIALSASILFGAEAEKVYVEYYYSPTCDHCDSILKEIIIPLGKEYPKQLNIELIDIDDEAGNNANYARLIKREEQLGQTAPDIPVTIIAGEMISGSTASRKRIPELIGQELAKLGEKPDNQEESGKAEESQQEQADLELSPKTVQEDGSVSQTIEKAQSPINIVYFFKKGCKHCDRVTYDLRLIKSEYPSIVIHKFDVESDHGGRLSEHLSFRAGVPEQSHLASPAIFIADTFILPEVLTFKALKAQIEAHKDNAPDISQASPEELEAAAKRIKTRFREFSAWAILGAGLVDGLNPCAFGVIIFFVMFLSTLKRSKWEIFITGTAFTIAVFLTYFLVGAGLLKFLIELPFFDVIAKWVFASMMILTFVLAVLSIVDFFRTFKGNAGDMLLKLPKGIKQRIHRTIIKENSPRAKRNMIVAASTTGFLISLMELACTGQVYLPTLVLMTRAQDTRGMAWLYLFLYNLMFIIPLVIIFAIALFGVSSQNLTKFLERNARWIKLLLAAIFFALAYYLAQDVPFMAPVVTAINGFFGGIFGG